VSLRRERNQLGLLRIFTWYTSFEIGFYFLLLSISATRLPPPTFFMSSRGSHSRNNSSRAVSPRGKSSFNLPPPKDGEEESQALLLNLVETGRVGPAIKTVLDKGWTDSYEPLLEDHIKKKEDEVCVFYGVFLSIYMDPVVNMCLNVKPEELLS